MENIEAGKNTDRVMNNLEARIFERELRLFDKVIIQGLERGSFRMESVDDPATHELLELKIIDVEDGRIVWYKDVKNIREINKKTDRRIYNAEEWQGLLEELDVFSEIGEGKIAGNFDEFLRADRETGEILEMEIIDNRTKKPVFYKNQKALRDAEWYKELDDPGTLVH